MKSAAALAGLCALVLGCLSSAAGAAPPATGATWNLASDLTANAKGAHTSAFADSYGDPAVWHMMGAPSTAHVPAGYTDFVTYTAAECSLPNVPAWNTGNTEPVTLINIGATTVTGPACGPGQVIDPDQAYGHPSNKPADLVFGWKSPISGTVTITGGISDADCGGGNGIAWFVDLGATDIDKGSFANCGKSTFRSGLTATVKPGDFIYFLVDPNGDYSYDLTKVEVTITAGASTAGATTTTTAAAASNDKPNTHQAIPDFWAALSARVITHNTLGLGRDLALTAGASNNQVLSVAVLERATGCLVEGTYVDLLDPNGDPVVPPGQIRHSVPQTRAGYLDIGGLKNLAAGLYHLWIYAKSSSGQVVMQGYLPIEVKDRGGQAFDTLNGRSFTLAGGHDWVEGKRATASAAHAAGNPFAAFVQAFQQVVTGIVNAVKSFIPAKAQAAAATAAKILANPKTTPEAKLELVQSKTDLTPAFLVTTTALQGAEALAAAVDPTKVGIVSHDGGTLLNQDGAGIVSHDGGTLLGQDGAGVIAAGAGNIVSAGAGNFVHGVRQTASAQAAAGGACLRGYKTVGDGNVVKVAGSPVLANADGKLVPGQYVIGGKNEMPVNGVAK